MLVICAEGMLLGYDGRMTSHQNEKDRWSRNYSCSKNFTSIALFGEKKTPQLEAWCQIFFKKLNSENSYELLVTDANKPGPLQLPTAMRFFDKLITVCANLLFSPKYTEMIEQGCVCLLTAQCLMPQKEQNINALMLSCEVYMTFANSMTHKRTPQDCPEYGMWSIIMSLCLQHTTYLPLHNWSNSVMVYHIKYNLNFSEIQYIPTIL